RRVAAGARNAVRRGGKPRGGARPKGPAANSPSTALVVRPKPGALVPYRSGLVGHEIIPLKDGWILQVSGNASRAVARHPKFPDMRVIFDHTGVRVWTRNPALRQLFHRPPGGMTAVELKEALKQVRRLRQPEKWQRGQTTTADDIWGGTQQVKHPLEPQPNHPTHPYTGPGGRDIDVQVHITGGTVNVEIKAYNRWATVNGRPVEQFVPLGKLRDQIAKDVAIMAQNPGTRTVWHFLDAHPSDELREALLAAKIIIRTD
ncbi:hypothetical protein OJ998_34825, partial [Solirubrobacter taibaiensis]|nr:hypothetical protein [Solirubrobacter taibaiensis]